MLYARRPHVDVRESAWPDAPLLTQALYGEPMELHWIAREGWYRINTVVDKYTGFVRIQDIVGYLPPPTHRVCVQRAPAFVRPHGRAKKYLTLGMNARVHVEHIGKTFSRVSFDRNQTWIRNEHLMSIGAVETDWVGAAQRCCGTPYLWGGRDSAVGLDCSGLIHNGLTARGTKCPRDSKDMRALGTPLDFGAKGFRYKRGDLVFFEGHVGVMVDARRLLHSTILGNGGVCVQPLHKVLAAREAWQPGMGVVERVCRLS
jgi:cell wall-associated NlpC family hydrolase